jgi:hypothetical protein
MSNASRHISSLPIRSAQPPSTWDDHNRLARIANDLTDAATTITDQRRDQADADRITPPFAQIVLSVDGLQTMFYEIEQFGFWSPNGRALLRLAGDLRKTARDLAREHQLLTEAARGHAAFVQQAEGRLAAGEDEFGDSWAWIGVRKHLSELLEECADVGSWSALCEQALSLDPRLTDQQREQVRAALQVAARHGAQAHQLLTNALNALGERR